MSEVLEIRPFVSAKDYHLSIAFYEALGFAVTYKDSQVAILRLASFSFILQNFYVEELAANTMVQLLVRDASDWWASLDVPSLVATFGVKQPIPPAMQHWGLKVGFLFDPSGVLWHVAEPPS